MAAPGVLAAQQEQVIKSIEDSNARLAEVAGIEPPAPERKPYPDQFHLHVATLQRHAEFLKRLVDALA